MAYIFLPFLSAALYGLSYVLIEKLLHGVPALTFLLCSMVVSSVFMMIVFGFIWTLNPESLSLEFLHDKKTAMLFIFTAVLGIVAWLTTLLSLQHNSASFVAFAEISYPVFTLLFLFILFGERHFTWQFMLGGAMILGGSIVLVMSQVAKS